MDLNLDLKETSLRLMPQKKAGLEQIIGSKIAVFIFFVMMMMMMMMLMMMMMMLMITYMKLYDDI